MQYSAHACNACASLFVSAAFLVLTRKLFFCILPQKVSISHIALFTFRALYIGYWLIGGGEILSIGLKLSCGIVTYCLGYSTTVGGCSKCDSYIHIILLL